MLPVVVVCSTHQSESYDSDPFPYPLSVLDKVTYASPHDATSILTKMASDLRAHTESI